jgi:hypothetical protein
MPGRTLWTSTCETRPPSTAFTVTQMAPSLASGDDAME